MEIKLIEAGTFERGKLRLRYVSKIEEEFVGTEMSFPVYHKWHEADCILSYGSSCWYCAQFDSWVFRLETEHVRIPEFNEDFEASLFGPKPLEEMSDEAHMIQTLFGLWHILSCGSQLPIPLIKTIDIPRLTPA